MGTLGTKWFEIPLAAGSELEDEDETEDVDELLEELDDMELLSLTEESESAAGVGAGGAGVGAGGVGAGGAS